MCNREVCKGMGMKMNTLPNDDDECRKDDAGPFFRFSPSHDDILA
jgi:hypothetical protein